MKYLCMAYEEEEKLNLLSPDEWATLRRETLDYVEELKRKGTLISAEPLQGGFFLIDARDRDEAIAIAARWPSARLGSIEVRPIEPGLREERRYGP